MLSVQHPALFWEMRLRKTATTIRFVKLRSDIHSILVMGPTSVLPGWVHELETENENDVWFISGDNKKRRESLNRLQASMMSTGKRTWVITNKEIHISVPEIGLMLWDAVILDESRFVANPRARVTRFCLRNFRKAKLRICLTGTAAPESDLEYFTQIQFLDYCHWHEKNYWEFRAKHFLPKRYDWVMRPESRPYILGVLNHCAFFLQRNQVKLGGVKVYERRAVELPMYMRKIYNKAQDEFLLEGEDEIHSTIWATQKYLWLRQLCSGFVREELTSNHKLELLWELLSVGIRGEQAVIWCCYKSELFAVRDFLFYRGEKVEIIYGDVKPMQRETHRQHFQSGVIKYLVIQPQSFKWGTNLTAAGALVYFSSPESAETRQQTEDRAVDISTNDSSLIVDLYCLDTIEEDIYMSNIRKESRQQLMHRIMNRKRNAV